MLELKSEYKPAIERGIVVRVLGIFTPAPILPAYPDANCRKLRA